MLDIALSSNEEKLRPQLTHTENFVKFGRVVFEIQTDIQTHRRTHHNTSHLYRDGGGAK